MQVSDYQAGAFQCMSDWILEFTETFPLALKIPSDPIIKTIPDQNIIAQLPVYWEM